MDGWPKDTSTVYISLTMGRVDSADLSTKPLCWICTAKSGPWHGRPWCVTFRVLEKQLLGLKWAVCFLHLQNKMLVYAVE